MKTIAESIIPLFERDLTALINNLNAYEHEADMWLIDGGIKNSAGNLTLHIVGNLRHFIGHVIGGTTYERMREEEFNSKDVEREDMIKEIELTIVELNSILHDLSEDELTMKYPIRVLGHDMTTAYFITHLYGHLNYHLGQINYHQRLLGHRPVGWDADS